MSLITLGYGQNQKIITLGLGISITFMYSGKWTVTETITGDMYNDWKYTVSDRHYGSPARIALRLLNYELEALNYIQTDDILIGNPVEVVEQMYKDYIISALFVAFCEKTVEAFQSLDEVDESGFTNKLQELQDTLNEMLQEMITSNHEVYFEIKGHPDERAYTTTLKII